MKTWAKAIPIMASLLIFSCSRDVDKTKYEKGTKQVAKKHVSEYVPQNVDTTFFGQLDKSDSKKGYVIATGYCENKGKYRYYKGIIYFKNKNRMQKIKTDFLPEKVIRFKLSGKPVIAFHGIEAYYPQYSKLGCRDRYKKASIYLYDNGMLNKMFDTRSDKISVMQIDNNIYFVDIDEKFPKEFFGKESIGIRDTYPPYISIHIRKWNGNEFDIHLYSYLDYADIVDLENDGKPELVEWDKYKFRVKDIATKEERKDLESELMKEKQHAGNFIRNISYEYKDKDEFKKMLDNYAQNSKHFFTVLRPLLENDYYINRILEKNAWKIKPDIMIKSLYTEKLLDEIDPLRLRKLLPKPKDMDYVIDAYGEKTKIWVPTRPYGWIRKGNGFAYIPRESRLENLDDKTIFRDRFGNPIVRSESYTPKRTHTSPFRLSPQQIQRAREINRQKREQARRNMQRARRDAERAMQNARKAAGSFLRQLRGKKK